jgi:hypothetical protein
MDADENVLPIFLIDTAGCAAEHEKVTKLYK